MSGRIIPSYHDYFPIADHRSGCTSSLTMAMLVDQINWHQTRAHLNISAWTRLEFILVSAVVFSKTYCVGVSFCNFLHVLTILSLPAGDSQSRPPGRARGHARKAVHWAKDTRIRYEFPEETKCHWQNALSVWACKCAQSWISQVEWLYAQWFIDTNLMALQGSTKHTPYVVLSTMSITGGAQN